MIYFDYAAHTPADPAVYEIMAETVRRFPASPNSSHALGRAAKQEFDRLQSRLRELAGLEDFETVLTSGATESNNLALKGSAHIQAAFGQHILYSPVEHSSVTGTLMRLREEGFEIESLALNTSGHIDLEDLRRKLRPDTVLVTLSSANSETGILQDLAAIASVIRESAPQAVFHCDATQSFGKLRTDYSVCDLISCTTHKLFGPTSGCGALFKRREVLLKPELNGGLSDTPYRSATPDLAAAAAWVAVAETAFTSLEESVEHVRKLQAELLEFFNGFEEIRINASENPYVINLSTAVPGEELKDALSEAGVFISTKSACVAKTALPLTVYELFKDKKRARNSIRLSLSRKSSSDEVAEFRKIFTRVYEELKHGKSH